MGGRNPQADQNDWVAAFGFRQNPKILWVANFEFPISQSLPGFGEIVKSFVETNSEFVIPGDLSGFGEIHVQSPSQAGNFCHASNIFGVAEIPRLTGGMRADFAKTLKIFGAISKLSPRKVFRVLAKSASCRPVLLGISDAPTLLPARQKSPERPD